MKPSLRAVLQVFVLTLLITGAAWGSVRLFRKGLPFPVEMVAILLALGFAGFFLLRGSALPKRRALFHALAGGGVAVYLGATLGGLPALVQDSLQGYNELFPGWSALLVSLAAGAALGAVLFGPLVKAGPKTALVPESEEPPAKRRGR